MSEIHKTQRLDPIRIVRKLLTRLTGRGTAGMVYHRDLEDLGDLGSMIIDVDRRLHVDLMIGTEVGGNLSGRGMMGMVQEEDVVDMEDTVDVVDEDMAIKDTGDRGTGVQEGDMDIGEDLHHPADVVRLHRQDEDVHPHLVENDPSLHLFEPQDIMMLPVEPHLLLHLPLHDDVPALHPNHLEVDHNHVHPHPPIEV